MVCSVDVVPSVICPRVVCSVDVGSREDVVPSMVDLRVVCTVDVGSREGTKRVVESEKGTKRVSVIIAVLNAVDAAAFVDVVVVVVCP